MAVYTPATMKPWIQAFSLLFLLISPAFAQEPARPFVPVEGQAGKDVVWVPSPPDMVDKLMELAKVAPADLVLDLGSGDGRNVIAAATRGAHAIGVEYNPNMVALSRRLAAEAGGVTYKGIVKGNTIEGTVTSPTTTTQFLATRR